MGGPAGGLVGEGEAVMLLFPTANSAIHEISKQSPGHYGFLVQPGVRGVRTCIQQGLPWAADNGAFAKFREEAYLRMLENHLPWKDTCLFAVAPDVLANHRKTLELWTNWHPCVRSMDYPVAFVAQDGCDKVPWKELDVLFIGGTNEFKDRLAVPIIREAQEQGVWTHVGRVNGRRRVRYCLELGVQSIDGTGFAIEPDGRLREYHRWIAEWEAQRRLF